MAATFHFLAGALYSAGTSSSDDAYTPRDQIDDGMDIVDMGDAGLPLPYLASILSICWFLPAIFYWVMDRLARTPQRAVLQGEKPTSMIKREPRLDQELMVMCASLEHSLPHLPKAKAVAGGLGKVMDLVARHHPTNILMVHPMVAEGEKVDYGPKEDFDTEMPLRILVDGTHEEVIVFRQSTWPHGPTGVQVDFVLLSHPLFEARTRESVYPNPMSRRAVLRFFSLWNQAVGALIVRYQPAIFHCPDFHTAVAPWYAHPLFPSLKVLLVLHNAEYQGTISTDMINGNKLTTMAKIWNLPPDKVSQHLVQDGRFNMLKSAVDFILKFQGGRGICAVSQYYAKEAQNMYSLLWPLDKIEGLDNPMLEEERAVLSESLSETKRKAKLEIQELLNLNVDPEARIFVSLGRLVRQKGVDLLADVAPWLLLKFPKAQFILIGPIGDGYGHYAANKLAALMSDERFKGRVFVRCEFMRVSDALKFAADFCLMPSRDEPFGYVDIEFAWRGAVVVGAQAGGLGKVPGFYYVAQNRENMARLRDEIKIVITQAMEVDSVLLSKMAVSALECDFPLAEWKKKLLVLYEEILYRRRWIAGRRDGGGTNGCSRGVDIELMPPIQVADSMASLQSISSRATPPSPQTRSPLGPGVGEQRRQTFRPYDIGDVRCRHSMPRPTTRQLAGPLDAPISAIDAAFERQKSYRGTIALAEFLTQELAEEEIAERVKSKLAEGDYSGIDDIVEQIGQDVDMERAEGKMAKWLLGTTFGMKRIHLCVSSGYVFTPVAGFLTFVVATEWGMRGGNKMPEWLKAYPWYSKVFSEKGIDPALMNVLLFSTNSLAAAMGAPIWAWLSMYTSPRKILAVCLILQGLVLFTLLPKNPTVVMAIGLVFFQGLIASAGLIFVAFNFMVSIKADLSHAALRMGMLEMLRYCVTWLFTGYMFFASPSAFQSTSESETMPVAVLLILLPVAVFMICTTLIPGVLCIFAPGPYKDDRCPGWDLKLFTKRTSFLLLSLSDCVGALAAFPSSYYVQWWLANGWTSIDLGVISPLLGLVLAVGAIVWFSFLSQALKHGVTPLIATATLVAPPSLLRAISQEEVSTHTFWGTSYSVMIICVLSLLWEGIRASAMWTVKIRVLNSRWRLLSYATMFITAQGLLGAISPFLCEYCLARKSGASFISGNQKELADATVASLAPFVVMQFVLQICSLPFMSRDLGSSAQEKRSATSWHQRLLRRSPIATAAVTAVLLGSCAFVVQDFLVKEEMPFTPTNHCRNADLSRCEIIKERVDKQSPVLGHSGFSKGYGWRCRSVDSPPEPPLFEGAKYNCQRLLRSTKDGNTFMVDPAEGRCQILKCPKDVFKANEAEGKIDAHVWSYHCDMRGKNLVGVQAFEWRWTDVGRECKDYFGKAGFDFVQISPPQEHVIGDAWWVRYRPVSFLLESRSGSKEEFEQMVKDCRKSGVEVMVDLVLNHMAANWLVSPYEQRNWICSADADNATRHETKSPCMGWTGTTFQQRRFTNTKEDHLDKQYFHHYSGNVEANCELPPWTHNRYLCDLFHQPDLDTEKPEVQRILSRYLLALYDAGVTMLRIDAAGHLYPASLAKLLEPLPLEYVVQEMYSDIIAFEPETVKKAQLISPITDFLYGQRVTQIFIDGYIDGNWTSRSKHFGELATFGTRFKPSPMRGASQQCPYTIKHTDLPGDSAMVFLDNHDSQRHRLRQGDDNPVCYFDGSDMFECRSTYKMGLMHRQATLYMLSYPYGDSVRIMSSYSFTDVDEGPPGISRKEYMNQALPVFKLDGRTRCKDTPKHHPATPEWDEEDKARPWVCEHRWRGIPGMISFRKMIKGSSAGKPKPQHADSKGHVAFSFGRTAFVALNRNGYNWFTKLGEDIPWDLTGVSTDLPEGEYCNMIEMTISMKRSKWPCPNKANATVTIGPEGKILAGDVEPYGVVAIHTRYSRKRDELKKHQANFTVVEV